MTDFRPRSRPQPQRKRSNNVLRFDRGLRNHAGKKPTSWWKAHWAFAFLAAAPLVGIGAAWFLPSHPTQLPDQDASFSEQYRVNFGRCRGPIRINCVVDGDTFWLKGTKYRIADINAPEVSSPDCSAEAAIGERATSRLVDLLNEGGFSLETIDRDEDAYGRKLRLVTRGGHSVGERLVAEGLAERWRGNRRNWC